MKQKKMYRFKQTNMTPEKVEHILNSPFTNSKQITNNRIAEYIFLLIKNCYDLPNDEYMTIKSRKPNYVIPRQVGMYFLRKYTSLTQEGIGRYYANKNHATVLHAERTVMNLCDSDKSFKRIVNELDTAIKFKSKSLSKNINIDKHFYYIDFENHTSLKLKDDKGIILSGFDEKEIERIKDFIGGVIDSRKHESTGLYILEQIDKK
jgi:hypothetical protein